MFLSLKLSTLACKSSQNEDNDIDLHGKGSSNGPITEHIYDKLTTLEEHSRNKLPDQVAKLTVVPRAKRRRCPREPIIHVRTKVIRVNVEREDGSLGITLRGGYHHKPELSKPLVITQIKPNGPAAREGTIKPGDRLLAVDGITLLTNTLSDAQTLLKHKTTTSTLTIEYDVNVLESVEHATGPLLIEVDRPLTSSLGLSFYQSDGRFIIENVKQGSFADRCGAFHAGDEILGINETRLDNTTMSVLEVASLLDTEETTLTFEILPANTMTLYNGFNGGWGSRGHLLSSASSLSGLSTLKSNTRRKHHPTPVDTNYHHVNNTEMCRNINMNPVAVCNNHIGLTYTETLHVTLTRKEGYFGIEFADTGHGEVVVSHIVPGSPADMCGCLQTGDRILSVNHRHIALDHLTAKHLNTLAGNYDHNTTNHSPASCPHSLTLHVEFDVLESVVPASGIFVVKLARRGSAALGITITACSVGGFIICEMKKGSMAQRAGSLMAGDKLLSINNIDLEQCSLDQAAQILHHSSDIVILRVQRNDDCSDTPGERTVVYTVELQRYGGPLGITIAGSDEPFQPITVSALIPGGLAEQTGALHVGDVILAINNHSLYGEPLSKAHALLQTSSDLVTLKLSRKFVANDGLTPTRSPILPPSVDSAVESWDSSRLDPSPSPEQIKSNETNDLKRTNGVQNSAWSPVNNETSTETGVMPADTSHVEENQNGTIFDEITNENLKIKQELDLLSDKINEQLNTNYDSLASSSNTDKLSTIKMKPKTKSSCGGAETQPIEVEVCVNESSQDDTDTLTQEDGYVEEQRDSVGMTDYPHVEITELSNSIHWFNSQYLTNGNNEGSVKNEFNSSQMRKVTLCKDPVYEDFGFSVSDGLYEKGVYINRIRKGGPADLSHSLKPYDRILQVNDTLTQDFDCCMTVPLIAAADSRLTLLVARSSHHSLLVNNVSSQKEQLRQSSNEVFEEYSQEENQRITV